MLCYDKHALLHRSGAQRWPLDLLSCCRMLCRTLRPYQQRKPQLSYMKLP